MQKGKEWAYKKSSTVSWIKWIIWQD